MLTKEQQDKINNNPKEQRSVANMNFRAEDEKKKMIIEGYAATFSNKTTIAGMFVEVILPGAFDNTDMKKVPLKYNHEDSYLAMASTKNKSLKLEVDKVGLRFEAELADTQSNRDIYNSVKSGILDECSFAFSIAKDGTEWIWPTDPKELPIRQIKKIERLYDIALVDLPAYDNTSVFARSIKELEDSKMAVEAEANRRNNLKIRMNMKIKIMEASTDEKTN
jgi:HK97 family phage prohead protease